MLNSRKRTVCLILLCTSILAAPIGVRAGTFVVRVYNEANGTSLINTQTLDLDAKDYSDTYVVTNLKTTTGKFPQTGTSFTATSTNANREVKFYISSDTTTRSMELWDNDGTIDGGINGSSTAPSGVIHVCLPITKPFGPDSAEEKRPLVDQNITGNVKSRDGATNLSGVTINAYSVTAPGTSIGNTTTDASGNYTLTVSASGLGATNKAIIIKYVYNGQTVTLTGINGVNIVGAGQIINIVIDTARVETVCNTPCAVSAPCEPVHRCGIFRRGLFRCR